LGIQNEVKKEAGFLLRIAAEKDKGQTMTTYIL
jgi:hypothetical protein